MGRPPKPAALRAPGADAQHKANGTLVPRAPSATRQRGDAAPEPPEDLGERGLREWNKIWAEGFWMQPDADYHWVLMLAQAYDDIEGFNKIIAAEGQSTAGYKNDMLVAHPLIKEKRVLQQLIIKCLQELGFSPSARARLGIQEAQARKAILDLQSAQARNRGDR
jgi:P27 family predicted phage terminase small subunit